VTGKQPQVEVMCLYTLDTDLSTIKKRYICKEPKKTTDSAFSFCLAAFRLNCSLPTKFV
jgi:hypothetical protein